MKSAIIHICLFILMITGLLIWLVSGGIKDISLDFIGLASLSRVEELILLITVICVVLPFFLSGFLVGVYFLIASNKDTKAYIQKEKSKHLGTKWGFERIMDKIFNVLIAISSLFIVARLDFFSKNSAIGAALIAMGGYILAFIVQSILYKTVKKQIGKIRRSIKNRKAWR